MKSAFTLVELLVVLAVIVILASVLVPTIGIVRRQAKDVVCQNNLSQIGQGILAYKQDNGNALPGTIQSLYKPASSPLTGTPAKLYLCPFDKNKGAAPGMGRPSPPTNWGDLTYLHEIDMSYCFEASEKTLDDSSYNWFFGTSGGNTTGKTWFEGKVYQLNHGTGRQPPTGKPYSITEMPILRCYHHADWTNEQWNTSLKKVLNLTWDLRIYWSIPTWELQAN